MECKLVVRNLGIEPAEDCSGARVQEILIGVLGVVKGRKSVLSSPCLLYTSDAADE